MRGTTQRDVAWVSLVEDVMFYAVRQPGRGVKVYRIRPVAGRYVYSDEHGLLMDINAATARALAFIHPAPSSRVA